MGRKAFVSCLQYQEVVTENTFCICEVFFNNVLPLSPTNGEKIHTKIIWESLIASSWAVERNQVSFSQAYYLQYQCFTRQNKALFYFSIISSTKYFTQNSLLSTILICTFPFEKKKFIIDMNIFLVAKTLKIFHCGYSGGGYRECHTHVQSSYKTQQFWTRYFCFYFSKPNRKKL